MNETYVIAARATASQNDSFLVDAQSGGVLPRLVESIFAQQHLQGLLTHSKASQESLRPVGNGFSGALFFVSSPQNSPAVYVQPVVHAHNHNGTSDTHSPTSQVFTFEIAKRPPASVNTRHNMVSQSGQRNRLE